VPAGRLADRFGRGRVFVGGHLLLLIVYTALLRPASGTGEVLGYVVLFGAYYAMTDGVLMALASAVLPAPLRTSGLALLTTVTSLARLFGSVLFGAMWTWWGAQTAITFLLAGLLVATVVAAVMLAKTDGRNIHEQATAG
jgi:MFS family permease